MWTRQPRNSPILHEQLFIASRTRWCRCVKWCFETLSEYCNWVPPVIQTSIAGNSSNSRWFTDSTWGFPSGFQPSHDIVNQSVLGINHSKSIPIRICLIFACTSKLVLSCQRPNIYNIYQNKRCVARSVYRSGSSWRATAPASSCILMLSTTSPAVCSLVS